nr:MFS transporter [uncultured Actinotalea sp.]
MSPPEQVPERGPRGPGSSSGVILVACLGAGIATTGIQVIAPGIPAIQAEFGLSTAQVALLTTAFLFPSMFSALGAGILADRFGVRAVFAGSMLLFGLAGALSMVAPDLAVLLLARALQGAAFGAALSLSVAIIGLVVPSGPAAARGQSRRIIAMAVAEAVAPAVGGLLIALAWWAPFGVTLLALPVAVLAWLRLPSARPKPRPRGQARTAVRSSPALVGVQVLAAARFITKYAVLTYVAVLAVTELGMSPAAVGLALGVASTLAAVSAALTERLAHRWTSPQLIAGALVTTTASMVAMAFAPAPAVLVGALLVFGLQDGVYGVAHNVLVTEMAPPEARSTYTGLTGTVRNVGKFTAPLLFGAATLVLTVGQSFLVLAAASAAALSVVGRVARAHRTVTAAHDG